MFHRRHSCLEASVSFPITVPLKYDVINQMANRVKALALLLDLAMSTVYSWVSCSRRPCTWLLIRIPQVRQVDSQAHN